MIVGKVILRNNGYEYTLLELVNDIVIVKAVSVEQFKAVHFEVWKLRNNPPSWVSRGMGDTRYPSNEEFGRYGWAFNTLADARKKLLSLLGLSEDFYTSSDL